MADTPNPYDRREPSDRLRRTDLGAGEAMMPMLSSILDDGRRAYPGFGLARLEEVMRDEYARGFNAGEAAEERRMEQRLPEIKRRVWDEGCAAGELAGRADLLESIADQFEEPLVRRVGIASDVLARHAKGDRSVTKGALAAQLEECRNALVELREAHHNGFAVVPT